MGKNSNVPSAPQKTVGGTAYQHNNSKVDYRATKSPVKMKKQ